MTRSQIRFVLVPALLLGLYGSAPGQSGTDPAGETEPRPPEPAAEEPLHPLDALLGEIARLRLTVEALRMELAQARLDTAAAQRELDEMHEFIRDHEAYGRDFEQYRSIRALAAKESRRRQVDAARRQREAERASRRNAIKEHRERRDAELNRLQGYRDKGFTPLGFDVFMGNAAFQYNTFDGVAARVDWNGLTGRFIRLHHPYSRVEFSTMTISGSVMNAAEVVRDIGIAITFFDEAGNQVGGEIVQVNNARPDVPYPFTTAVSMALNRPFASSSSYVLYADPVSTATP